MPVIEDQAIVALGASTDHGTGQTDGSGGLRMQPYPQRARHLEHRPDYDLDALVIYDDKTDPEELIDTAEALRQKGLRVRVQREAESQLTSREVIWLGKEARA